MMNDKIKKAAEDTAKKLPRIKESEAKNIFKPLEKVVPEKWRDGFMYMGRYDYNVKHPDRIKKIKDIHDYKHGITRKYLHINPDGSCFCNITSKDDNILLEPCSCDIAMNIVFKNIKEYGASRETSYDEKYKYERNKALSEEGYEVLNISPGKLKRIKNGEETEEEY